MIYKATKLIKQEMDKQELNSSINEYEKSSNVQAGYNIQNGPYIQVDFISSDDDNDVAVRVFGLYQCSKCGYKGTKTVTKSITSV